MHSADTAGPASESSCRTLLLLQLGCPEGGLAEGSQGQAEQLQPQGPAAPASANGGSEPSGSGYDIPA